MAFPTVETTASTNGASATNKVCNLPTGIVKDSLLFLSLRSNAADTHTTPSGWTSLVLNNSADASDDNFSIWYRVSDGTDGATITVNGTAAAKFSSVAWRVHNHDKATAPVVSTVATGTTANPDAPALTPAGGSKDFLWCAYQSSDGVPTISSYPASYTVRQIAVGTSGGAAATNSQSSFGGRQLTAATEDPGTYTLSAAPSNGWSAATFAAYPGPDPVSTGINNSLMLMGYGT